MDSFFNIKTATDFAYLMNLVESSFRSNLIMLAHSFQFFVEIFYAGVCSPFHMLGKLFEEGLIYFLLFFSTLQKRANFHYTFSSTAPGALPPPSKRKTQIVTLKRNTNPIQKPLIVGREMKIEQQSPVKTIILSRGINTSSKISSISTISALSISKNGVAKNDRSRSRFYLRKILRTFGLCIALLALTPSSKTKLGLLNLEKTKFFFQNIGSIDVVQGLKDRRNRIKTFFIRLYENRFNRSKGTSVLPSNEDGVAIFTGETYPKYARIPEGCPYLKSSRNVL